MITLVPAGVAIPVGSINNGACANPDGHGWAVASIAHGLQVGKSMDPEVALAEFTAARDAHGPGSVGLFHSRLGTHGEDGIFNVHPFPVPGTEDKTVMCHNGILPKDWIPEKGDRRSDTQVFNETTAPLFITERGVPSRRGATKIGEAIGKGNKLVFLSVLNGKVVTRIVNVDSGVWDGGVWYSNTWYKQKRFGGGSWSKGTSTGAHSWWGDEDYYSPYFGESWTQHDEDKWQAEKAEKQKTFDQMLADIDAGLSGEVEPENPLDLSVVTDVLEDYACDFCEIKGAVHATTMTCLACGHCLDCFETAANCDCFDWEEYLAKRQEEEALWISGLRDEMVEAE